MVVHKCNKETEIAEIKTMVDSIHHELMGNGQPGLLKEWYRLKGSLDLAKFLGASGIITSLITLGIVIFSYFIK